MRKWCTCILCTLLILSGCVKQDNETKVRVSTTDVVTTKTEEEAREIPVLEDVKLYSLNDKTIEELAKVFKEDEAMAYYLKLHPMEPLIEEYQKSFDIIAQGKDCPTIYLWQNALGEWQYNYRLYYDYSFQYTKNGTTRDARLELRSMFGDYDECWYQNEDSRYEVIDLQANSSTFTIRIHDGKIWDMDDKEELIFTPDLEAKILKYFEEFEENALFDDVGLVSKLTNVIETYGDYEIYHPFQIGDDLDEYIATGDTSIIQSIEPLLYWRNDDLPIHYELTDMFVFESQYSYGILDKDHKVILPCLSNLKLEVVDGDQRLELSNYFSTLDFYEANSYNFTNIWIPGGHGFYMLYYLYDGQDVYKHTYTDDGDRVTKLERPYEFMFSSFPAEYIINVRGINYGDYSDYTYDSRGYVLLNNEGQALTKEHYYEMKEVCNDYVPAIKYGGQWCLLDSKGDQVLDCEYDDISYVHDHYVVVRKDWKYGVIDVTHPDVMVLDYIKASKMVLWDETHVIYQNYDRTWQIINFK